MFVARAREPGFARGVGEAAVGQVGCHAGVFGEEADPLGQYRDQLGGEVVLVEVAQVRYRRVDLVRRAVRVQAGVPARGPGLGHLRGEVTGTGGTLVGFVAGRPVLVADPPQLTGEPFGRGLHAQPWERAPTGPAGRLPDGAAEPAAAQELGELSLVFSAKPDAFHLTGHKRVERLGVVRRGQGGLGCGGADSLLPFGQCGLGGRVEAAVHGDDLVSAGVHVPQVPPPRALRAGEGSNHGPAGAIAVPRPLGWAGHGTPAGGPLCRSVVQVLGDQIPRGGTQRLRQHTGDDGQQPLRRRDVTAGILRLAQPLVERGQHGSDEVVRADHVLQLTALVLGHRRAEAGAEAIFELVVGAARSGRDQRIDHWSGGVRGQRGAVLVELATVLEQLPQRVGRRCSAGGRCLGPARGTPAGPRLLLPLTRHRHGAGLYPDRQQRPTAVPRDRVDTVRSTARSVEILQRLVTIR